LDSGIGGLTVVNAVKRRMPNEAAIYFGDTARVPYGGKDRETLTGYGREIIKFLIEKDVKAVVVACGTLSSNAYDTLKKEFDLPMVDVLRPGIDACAELKPKRVGFIATEATVRRGLFSSLLKEKLPGAEVFERACPLFVPIAEEGCSKSPVARTMAEVYLEGWIDLKLDAVVLGCTHYPLYSNMLREILGGVKFIDLSDWAAAAAEIALKENNLFNESNIVNKNENYTFYVSGDPEKFDATAESILGFEVTAQKINL